MWSDHLLASTGHIVLMDVMVSPELNCDYRFLVGTIGGGNRGARGPWSLLNPSPLHRNVIFTMENYFSLSKWPP